MFDKIWSGGIAPAQAVYSSKCSWVDLTRFRPRNIFSAALSAFVQRCIDDKRKGSLLDEYMLSRAMLPTKIYKFYNDFNERGIGWGRYQGNI